MPTDPHTANFGRLESISANALFEVISSGAEYAVIDVREPRVTAREGSLLLGVVVPFGRLETRIAALVPRRNTDVIVYDTEDAGLARRAAGRLIDLGYESVVVLDGGVRAWAEYGHKVQYGGVHVIGQAFGEWVETHSGTPSIDIDEYVALLESGTPTVLLDSRPESEFRHHSLPGAIPIPGAELAYRGPEVIRSPDTVVVVHCAGRTRSILGAQTLIDAGIPNRVVSLAGGTQAWELSGRRVSRDRTPPLYIAAGLRTTARARDAALELAHRFGIHRIRYDEIESLRAESNTRTLYLFDVRTPEEFVDGHLPGAVSAPSWQLVPWTFRFAATRNARIVLSDNDEVRAIVVASWLTRLGWREVFVVQDGLADAPMEFGAEPTAVLESDNDVVRYLSCVELRTLSTGDSDVTVLDLGSSSAYASGHIPGALFALRSRLAEDLGRVPGSGPIVLTSEDGILARLAAAEVQNSTDRPVLALREGNAGWQREGLSWTGSAPVYFHPPDDVYGSGWTETDPAVQIARFREYLDWELGLAAEVDMDPTSPFVGTVGRTKGIES
ncbi:hypothetical protein CH267_12935 [Rhodococcus sp. 06-621-2]|nr:rhodanese-like domain-containing protein [Rhodococcus sp. 06-621-2]OZC55479.1 hypothetical protein CH267_12935 [Rhodococcus sp. 06-621-2]